MSLAQFFQMGESQPLSAETKKKTLVWRNIGGYTYGANVAGGMLLRSGESNHPPTFVPGDSVDNYESVEIKCCMLL
jgi:hypothetical protein